MNRRTLLAWLNRALQACIAAVVVVPGAQYIIAGLRPARNSKSTHQRVARLKDLPAGQPLQVAIMGRKQDAWTTSDSQVIGRVWLVRSDSAEPVVQAFNSLCPHMGCQIQLAPQAASFVCPCHRAAFGKGGQRI